MKKQTQHSDPARIIINLLKMLLNYQIKSSEIINYIVTNRIDVNSYIPSNMNMELPIIYYCCSRSDLYELTVYLINNGANLSMPIKCNDPTKQIELLYYSQIEYIPLLISRGCILNPSKVKESIEMFLIRGNILKLMTLYKNKALNKEQLMNVLCESDIIFKILDFLYQKIFNLSRDVKSVNEFTKYYNEIMDNYILTFKLFTKNGINLYQFMGEESFVQRVLNTYFIKLIDFITDGMTTLDNDEFLHYSNFDINNRQIMNLIYNERAYKTINQMLKDKMLIINHQINIKSGGVRKIKVN